MSAEPTTKTTAAPPNAPNRPPTASHDPPVTLTLHPWHDAFIEATGFPVGDPYVEVAWLPVLGPSTTLALRRLGLLAMRHPGGTMLSTSELSADLGLGRGIGRGSTIAKTLGRLVRFDMACWRSDDLFVRTQVPPVPERLAVQFSPAIAAAHRRMTQQRFRQTRSAPPAVDGTVAGL